MTRLGMMMRFMGILLGGLMRPRLIPAIAFTACAAGALMFSIVHASDDDGDDVILSFSTVGDSRQDPTSPDPTTVPVSAQDSIWLQNTKAWSRIMRSIEHQRSNFLFFNGDMIMGYGRATVPTDNTTVSGLVASDLMKFYRQYGFWRGMVTELLETGTYVVPVPGNHETQCNRPAVSTLCSQSGKHAEVENEDAWRANMSDLILDDARFENLFGEKPSYENVADNGVLDSLSTDQSKLSYSFDLRGSHFVVINTDPVGKDAHAPTTWMANDLADAQARGARHFFVFGHKPAFTYYYGAVTPLPASPSGLDNDVAARDAFWDVIARYHATYFCGHEHIFHVSRHASLHFGKAWQVLVGSGGSPFDAKPTDVTRNPSTDRDYAWATVKVHENGTVKITAYGFSDQYGPTRKIGSLNIQE
jgi:hypothetical protein